MEDNALLVEIAKALGELKKGQEVLQKTLSGNGQPGLAQRVEELEASKNRVVGAVAVLGTIGTGVWGFLEYIFHFTKGAK